MVRLNIYRGSICVRQELVDNVPDVVRITDAIVEATLWLRLNVEPGERHDGGRQPEERAAYLADAAVGRVQQLVQTDLSLPDRRFLGEENGRIAKWLFDNKRLKGAFTQKDFSSVFAPQFMKATFERLAGRFRPCRPPLPPGWTGKQRTALSGLHDPHDEGAAGHFPEKTISPNRLRSTVKRFTPA